MPSKGWYVNGLDELLEDSIDKMKGYNRQYMRDMRSLFSVEKVFQGIDMNEYSIPDLKKMAMDTIHKKGMLDPAHGGKLPILCKDKKVRYYDPEKWSETIARTRSRALQEKGLHNEMAEAGFDLVIVSIGGSGDMCRHWEGKILSISGGTSGVETVAHAQRIHLFHPNCFIDHQVNIFTSKGWKQIGDIAEGELVLTHKGRFRKVTALIRNHIPARTETTKFWFDNHHSFPSMTDGHPVLTRKGWVAIERLRVGDEVQVLATKCVGCEKLVPAWKKCCSYRCKSSFYAKKNWREGVYDDRTNHSKSLKASYASGKIDRFAITRNANIATRKLVKEGKHIFQRPETIHKANSVLAKNKYGSSSELAIRELLDSMSIRYVHTFPFKRKLKFKHGSFHKYYIDIAIPDKKIAIECYGSHWHPTNDSERDQIRQSELEEAGWTILWFHSERVRDNIESCRVEIERVLKNHNGEYQFIFVSITRIERKALLKGKTTYNLSVDEDESYVVKHGFVAHNCVHSTSPVIITEDESGPKIWGRSDLPKAARESLRQILDQAKAFQLELQMTSLQQFASSVATLKPGTRKYFVYKKISDGIDEDELIRLFAKEYGMDEATARGKVRFYISDLKKNARVPIVKKDGFLSTDKPVKQTFAAGPISKEEMIHPWLSKKEAGKLVSQKDIDDLRKLKGIELRSTKLYKALNHWTSTKFSTIRKVEADLFSGVRTVASKEVKLLESFLDRAPKYRGSVSRGTKTVLTKKVGDVYETRAMSSFSRGSVVSDFKERKTILIVEKSSRGVDISKSSAFREEREIFMPKGRYNIKEIRKTGLKVEGADQLAYILEEM